MCTFSLYKETLGGYPPQKNNNWFIEEADCGKKTFHCILMEVGRYRKVSHIQKLNVIELFMLVGLKKHLFHLHKLNKLCVDV